MALSEQPCIKAKTNRQGRKERKPTSFRRENLATLEILIGFPFH